MAHQIGRRRGWDHGQTVLVMNQILERHGAVDYEGFACLDVLDGPDGQVYARCIENLESWKDAR